jgi:type II secretory pathway pseudopilin PulG
MGETVSSIKKFFTKHAMQIRGFTLVEIMFAMGIFILLMWSVAHSLVYSYAVLEIQEQRNTALASCQAVLAAMRELSYNTQESADCTGGRPVFPCVLLNYSNSFPETLEGASAAVLNQYGSFFTLREQQFQLEMRDDDGAPAQTSVVAAMNTNPVYVTVTTTWLGARNHRFTVSASAIITNS